MIDFILLEAMNGCNAVDGGQDLDSIATAIGDRLRSAGLDWADLHSALEANLAAVQNDTPSDYLTKIALSA